MKSEWMISLAAILAITLVGWHILPHDDRSAPKQCRTLPTAAPGWALVSSNNRIYLCFEQGAAQGVTEVRCVPLEDCPEESR